MANKIVLLFVLIVLINVCVAKPSRSKLAARLSKRHFLKPREYLRSLAEKYDAVKKSDDSCEDVNPYSCVHQLYFNPNQPCDTVNCALTCGMCEEEYS